MSTSLLQQMENLQIEGAGMKPQNNNIAEGTDSHNDDQSQQDNTKNGNAVVASANPVASTDEVSP